MLLLKIVQITLEFVCLGIIIAAAGMWAVIRIFSKPRYVDFQTLVGGALWSQIVIPIGMLISQAVGEKLNTYIHNFYVASGILLLFVSGVFLIVAECCVFLRQAGRRRERQTSDLSIDKVDILFFCIGNMFIVAGIIKSIYFILLLYYGT